jgi:hypothetical protein
MAELYVRSTDGSNADGGTTWALAKATIAGADAVDAAGDRINVSQVHAETAGASVIIAYAGTILNPTKLVCGNDANAPPTAGVTTPTASVTATGAFSISLGGVGLYCRGIIFNASSGATSQALIANATGGSRHEYEYCNFINPGTGASGTVQFGPAGSTAPTETIVNKCGFKFGAAGHVIAPFSKLRINGGSLLAGGTSPTNLVGGTAINRGVDVIVTGFDLSNASAGINLVLGGSVSGTGLVLFRNCKLPSSWSGALVSAAYSQMGQRAEMRDCWSTTLDYKYQMADGAGVGSDDSTVYENIGGAFQATPFSWKFVTNTNCKYPSHYLESTEFGTYIGVVPAGGTATITVEFMHDSLTALNNDQIWLEIFSKADASSPLATFNSTRLDDQYTSAAAVTTSTATWTGSGGLTNPNKQKLSMSVSIARTGMLYARVCIAVTSKTLWLQPHISLS